jgi:peptide/nickel transport system substrate-binding protein
MRNTWWLALAVLVGACTSTPSTSPTAPGVTTTSSASTTTTLSTTTTVPDTETTTLRVGTVVPSTSLDPADAFTLGDWELLQAIGEGLLVREPGNGNVIPGLAEDMPEVSDDGRTYTMRIPTDIEFADGLKLTAGLYVEGIERVMRLGGRGSDLVSLFVESVEAPDDKTIVFHLHDGYAFFPTLLTMAPYLPIHPDAYPPDELQPFPEAPVYGVGPWFIDSYSDTELTLQANPRYRGDRSIDRIVIRYFADIEEMTANLINGDLDLAWRGVDAATADEVAGVEEITFEPAPGGTLHFLVVNHNREPTDDPLVRQALAELIDRDKVAETVLTGGVDPTFSPVPGGFPGSTESFLDVYGEPDVAAAIDLLTEGGYSETERAQLELAYPPERFGVEMAAALEEMELQIESTGLVDVTLTAQPWSSYVGDVVEGAYNVAFLGWIYDFPDPHNYLAPFVLNGGLGGSGENLEFPEMVEMIVDASIEHDPESREALYREIQLLYAQDVVTIPLWLDYEYIVYWDHVAGDPGLDNAATLNVGATMQLDFRTLKVEADDS